MHSCSLFAAATVRCADTWPDSYYYRVDLDVMLLLLLPVRGLALGVVLYRQFFSTRTPYHATYIHACIHTTYLVHTYVTTCTRTTDMLRMLPFLPVISNFDLLRQNLYSSIRSTM